MLTEHNLEAFIRSPYDWRVVVIEAGLNEKNRGFYLCKLSDLFYQCSIIGSQLNTHVNGN